MVDRLERLAGSIAESHRHVNSISSSNSNSNSKPHRQSDRAADADAGTKSDIGSTDTVTRARPYAFTLCATRVSGLKGPVLTPRYTGWD
jgi:hypothetical protein